MTEAWCQNFFQVQLHVSSTLRGHSSTCMFSVLPLSAPHHLHSAACPQKKTSDTGLALSFSSHIGLDLFRQQAWELHFEVDKALVFLKLFTVQGIHS